MKVWYQWFYLSLVFAVGGLINYLNGKPIIAAIIQVCITAVLFLSSSSATKKEKKEKGISMHQYRRNLFPTYLVSLFDYHHVFVSMIHVSVFCSNALNNKSQFVR